MAALLTATYVHQPRAGHQLHSQGYITFHGAKKKDDYDRSVRVFLLFFSPVFCIMDTRIEPTNKRYVKFYLSKIRF